jgi:hypothetical protein
VCRIVSPGTVVRGTVDAGVLMGATATTAPYQQYQDRGRSFDHGRSVADLLVEIDRMPR